MIACATNMCYAVYISCYRAAALQKARYDYGNGTRPIFLQQAHLYPLPLRTVVLRRRSEYGIGCGQQFFLLRISQLPGISLLELAQIGSFDRGTATRAVQKLEELGYIRRVGDPNDRRVVRLYVTEKARPVIEATLAARQRWNDILTQGMTSKQREAAKTLLVAMSQNAHQYVSNDSAPHGRAAHKQADQTGKEE